MKIYIALVLAVSAVSATVSTPERCTKVKSENTFDMKKFFSGTWYMTHVKVEGRTVTRDRMKCTTITAKTCTDCSVKEVFSYYSPTGDSFTYIEIIFSTTSGENNQYKVEYRPVTKEGYPTGQNFYPATITILGTDYKNYGLFYLCDHDENKSPLYGITSREKEATKVESMVSQTLTDNNLKLTDFTSIKDLKCKYP
ncbi:nitrophorin-1-like isoform X2 [Rhodnius prolixus]|uniref:nitrophorin-1-like isoform X2 n=1 Tax=Rhodnius prolixus TaxID=13249 RepID=UPI003D18FA9C